MDLRVGLESSVNVIVPMVTDDNGYSVQLDIRLDKPELQTSINFANLLTAERCTVKCPFMTIRRTVTILILLFINHR